MPAERLVAPPRPVTPLGIVTELLASVSRRLEQVPEVGDDVRADLQHALDLAAGVDGYVARCTTPASPPLARLQERTAGVDWSARPAGAVHLEQEMLSGHVEGALLQLLVHATGARRVLEIGMFTGYSALAMAEALPPGGTVVACEIDAAVARFASDCFAASPAGERIRIEVGPALETLTRLAAAGERFDLVFVDADKASYAAYLDALLEGDLLAPRGLICVDNTLLQGEPWTGPTSANGRAIADFNASVTADDRVVQVVLPIRDGLTLIRRA